MKKVTLIITLTIVMSSSIYGQKIDSMKREEFVEYLQEKLKDILKNIRYMDYDTKKKFIYEDEYLKARQFKITAEELYTEEMKLRLIELMSEKWTRDELDFHKKRLFKKDCTDDYYRIKVIDIEKKGSKKTNVEICDSLHKLGYNNIKDKEITDNNQISPYSREIFEIALYLKDKRFIKALKKIQKKSIYSRDIYFVLAGLKVEPYYSDLKKKYEDIKLNTVLSKKEAEYLDNADLLLFNQVLGDEGVYLYSRLVLVKDFPYKYTTLHGTITDPISKRPKYHSHTYPEYFRKKIKEKIGAPYIFNINEPMDISDKEALEYVDKIKKDRGNYNKYRFYEDKDDCYHISVFLYYRRIKVVSFEIE